MGNKQPEARKLLRELNAKLKILQEELVTVQKREGVDSYIPSLPRMLASG